MSSRWLLPFTHGVDMRAIDYLVSLAKNNGATLIPVPNHSRSGGARLEHIQQSKDFLEAVKYTSARLQVPIERYEVFTGDVILSITKLVQDLLHAHELKQLLVEPPASLVLIRLPANQQEARALQLGASFLSLLRRLWRYKADVEPMESTQEAESITQVIVGGK